MDKQVYEFIAKQLGTTILERRTCDVSGKQYPVFQEEYDMLPKLSFTFNGNQYLFPISNLSPEERMRIKFGQVNQMTLYKRTCSYSGDSIISNYTPDSPYKVFAQKYFFSDANNAMEYGREVDFSRPFFEQFHELDMDVPHPPLFTDYIKDQNSAYTNYAGQNKDCYLLFDSDQNEGCMYSYGINASRKSIDCYRSGKLENCIGAIDTQNSYHCVHIRNSDACSYCYFVKNCTNCKNCIMCSNLVNQEYCYKNQKISKEEFEKIKASLADYDTFQSMLTEYETFINQFPQRATVGFRNQNAIGNVIVDSKNVLIGFDSMNCEDVIHASQVFIGGKMSMNIEECGDCQLTYESNNLGVNAYKVAFSDQCLTDISYLLYCRHCFNGTKHCFGSIGLVNKQYCILNKQYTEQEYNDLAEKLIQHMQSIGEWGKNFPLQDAHYPYNTTLAHQRSPLAKEEALAAGYQWTDKDNKINIPAGADTINGADLPSIDQATDALTKKVVICAQTGRPYRILQPELDICRFMKIPLPRVHHDVRYEYLFSRRPARNLYVRTCDKTGKEMLSVYPPNTLFPVYSEEAYDQEVYS